MTAYRYALLLDQVVQSLLMLFEVIAVCFYTPPISGIAMRLTVLRLKIYPEKMSNYWMRPSSLNQKSQILSAQWIIWGLTLVLISHSPMSPSHIRSCRGPYMSP